MGLADFSKSPYDVPGTRTGRYVISEFIDTSIATRRDFMFRAPCDLKITAAWIVSTATYTGAGTNYRSTNLQNGGAASAGTTEMASWDGDSGSDLVANVPVALTLTSTAADLLVTEDEIVVMELEEVGTGLGLVVGTSFIIEWQPS